MFSGWPGIGGIIGGIITLALGIIILVWPRFLITIIGLWLIVVGIITIITSL